MTEPSAPPLSLAATGIRDPDHPELSFDTSEWNERIFFADNVAPSRKDVRRYHLTQFKSITNPTAWNRYLHLGLYAYDDGLEFDCIWDDPETEWEKRHKIVWYNYAYHLQHALEVPIKLKAWVTNLSQPFLKENAPDFMVIDTRKKSWRDLYYADDAADMDLETPVDDWTEIGSKQKASSGCKTSDQYVPGTTQQVPRIHPPPVHPKLFGAGGTTLTTLSNRHKSSSGRVNKTTILGRMASKSTASIRSAWAKSQGGLNVEVDSGTARGNNHSTVPNDVMYGQENPEGAAVAEVMFPTDRTEKRIQYLRVINTAKANTQQKIPLRQETPQ
ncbi:hypothetical protein MHU86_15535 [Fragilaria crotonensis]|nr:hypothetical protein MHU86_15535 [Fragilaria crotonensis]